MIVRLLAPVYAILLSALSALLLPAHAATLKADSLEYVKSEDKFVASGNVLIEQEGAKVYADKAVYYQSVDYAEASGRVIYEDEEAIIRAEEAELRLDAKTGRIRNAVILFKRGNYWLSGNSLEKVGEDHYKATEATFTTCDSAPLLTPSQFRDISVDIPLSEGQRAFVAERPDWCFRGKDVDIVLGERMIARNASFRVRGLPVFYSPVAWAPVMVERQTGFLFPTIGNSSRKGFQFSPSFFWAIDDNKDATVYLDYYSKRGLGTGLEYRYVEPDFSGGWFAYYIRDREFNDDFFEIKGIHTHRKGPLQGFLDVNYLNDTDFYREYGFTRGKDLYSGYGYKGDIWIDRFLQSTGEVAMPLRNSRLYLIGQYWVDLNSEDTRPPQKLPELGYALYPTDLGPFKFSLTAGASNFVRDIEPSGQRIDIMPTLTHSFGDTVQIFQSLSLRETAYSLRNEGSFESSPHRETLGYQAQARMRLSRKYQDLLHIIEPTLEYSFIPDTVDLPLFDSTELFNKISEIRLSVVNTLISKSLFVTTRLTQPYDFYGGRPTDPFLPTRLEVAVKSPLHLRLDMRYDFSKNRTDVINSEIAVPIGNLGSVSAGERYDKANDLLFFTLGFDAALTKKMAVNASIWYDGKGEGLRESSVRAVYREQCWVLNLILTRKPGDATRPVEYNAAFNVELRGVGTLKFL